jgi:starch-binding outer membrane protein, SusD/RagB family
MSSITQRKVVRGAIAGAVCVAVAACGGLLDVDNPNNVNAEALGDPASAAAQVNGVLASLTRGATQLIGQLETASDDISWTGSLDGMDRLNRGFVRDPFNEFVEDATTGMYPVRYNANRTIKQLEKFKEDRTLADARQLALVNLYAAVAYDYIANHYDDFVIASDQREGGSPVGSDKMVTLYDSVLAAVSRGLDNTTAATDRGQLIAMRARAKFDRAIWTKINPSGKAVTQPLVDDQGAADDAVAALALLGADGRLTLVPQNGMAFGNCFFPSCTNSRREIRFHPSIATYNYTTKVLTVALQDPITKQADPALAALINEFVTGNLLSPVTVTGSRDMLLIIAEVALAKGNTAEFTTRINTLRALNQLPPWTGAAGQPTALEMLKHERRVNLYLQGRRLNDMYRFGIVDVDWNPQSDAATCAGSMFPINNGERLSNPNAADSQPGCGK